MTNPDIVYYANMVDVTGNKKTLKYQVQKECGFYPPMKALIGKDGVTSFYLMASKDSGSNSDNAPSMRLQGKGSLNLTGLKEYFVNGKISGFAYGYPLDKETYSKNNKPNPFYEYKDDCFLFIIHCERCNNEVSAIRPTHIEMIVLNKAKVLGAAYLKQLVMGGFDDELNRLREVAR